MCCHCSQFSLCEASSLPESTGLVDGMKTEIRTYGAVSSVRDHPVGVYTVYSQYTTKAQNVSVSVQETGNSSIADRLT